MVEFTVLNELSLPLPEHSNHKEIFIGFFKLYKKLQENYLTIIRTNIDFKSDLIIHNRNFKSFLNEQISIDREFYRMLKSLFGNIIIKTPLIEEDNEELENSYIKFDYKYDDKEAEGFSLAFLCNTIAVSFNSDKCWDKSNISLVRKKIDSSEEEIKKVRHCSDISHIESHKSYLEGLAKYKALKLNVSNFWEKREKIFSKIIFCKEVEDTINKMDKKIFDNMISKLLEVDSGRKSIKDYKWSPEGKCVRQDPKLIQKRRVTLPNGEKTFFDEHVKCFGGNRFYFKEIGDSVYIGYVGKHLKTKKY